MNFTRALLGLRKYKHGLTRVLVRVEVESQDGKIVNFPGFSSSLLPSLEVVDMCFILFFSRVNRGREIVGRILKFGI